MLTERWNGRGREAAGLTASSGGGEERGSWPGLLRRSSGRQGCRNRLAASLGRRTRVIGVQDSTAANKIERRSQLTGGEVRRDSGKARV